MKTILLISFLFLSACAQSSSEVAHGETQVCDDARKLDLCLKFGIRDCESNCGGKIKRVCKRLYVGTGAGLVQIRCNVIGTKYNYFDESECDEVLPGIWANFGTEDVTSMLPVNSKKECTNNLIY